MKMKKILIVCMPVFLIAGPIAFADDLFPPSWRGEEGSTFQEWDFSTDNVTPVPDVVKNPYGEPLLRVKPIGDWISDPGAWPLSGEIDVYIPNWPEPRPEKEIWIQLTWKATDVDPFLPNEPVVGVTSYPLFEFLEMSRTDLVDFVPGWNHSLFKINLYPNPFEEWITIKGDILVDQLVIDTICIPEPATLALLGIGGLVILNLKRQSALKIKN